MRAALALLLLLLAVFTTVRSDGEQLAAAFRNAASEGALLLRRLAAFQARVRTRLYLEEAIEHSERMHRSSLMRTPLPTAVPRVYEPGDAHVALEELPGLAPLGEDAAHAREWRAQQARVASAQSRVRAPPSGATATPAPAAAVSAVPPLSQGERVAVRMGVLLARVRALSLLRLHGLGVEEDYQGRVVAWARNVTLEQLFATAPGFLYATDTARQGAGFLGERPAAQGGRDQVLLQQQPLATMAAKGEAEAPNAHSVPFLSLAYFTPLGQPHAAEWQGRHQGGVEDGEGKGQQQPAHSLYAAGASRAASLLEGIPLLAEPPPSQGSGAAHQQPQFLPQGTAPLGAPFRGAPIGSLVLDPSRGQLPYHRRPSLNPAVTHRYGILTPIDIAFTPQEARQAALVRALQGLGLLVSPLRAVVEVGALAARWVLPSKALEGALGLVEAGVEALAWGLPGMAVEGVEGALWWAAQAVGLEGAGRAVAALYFEVAFAVRYRVGVAASALRWAGGVVWGTGGELFCSICPMECIDRAYRRAEVAALNKVLDFAAELEALVKAEVEELQRKPKGG